MRDSITLVIRTHTPQDLDESTLRDSFKPGFPRDSACLSLQQQGWGVKLQSLLSSYPHRRDGYMPYSTWVF